MKTVLNKKSNDILKQPMFLGEDLGLQRYDIVKYPEFKKSYLDQQKQFWRPNEISLDNDRAQFENLSKEEKFIFVNNLMFQTMGDSCLSRTIDTLKKHVSNSELEYAMNCWLFMENVHSESYTHILQNITKDPSEFFVEIYDNQAVMNRANELTTEFDKLLGESNDIKQDIFNTVLSLQIAEGILFYVSFACSYWFGSRGSMKGNSNIIKLINNDESLHVAITQNIMNNWKKDPTEGFQDIVIANEDKVYAAYELAVNNEKKWARHLFSNGSLLGLNEDIMHNYVEWLANIRLRSMGYDKIYHQPSNPLGGWIKEYINSDQTETAPQENNILDYVKGGIKNDVSSMDFSNFKL